MELVCLQQIQVEQIDTESCEMYYFTHDKYQVWGKENTLKDTLKMCYERKLFKVFDLLCKYFPLIKCSDIRFYFKMSVYNTAGCVKTRRCSGR